MCVCVHACERETETETEISNDALPVGSEACLCRSWIFSRKPTAFSLWENTFQMERKVNEMKKKLKNHRQ